MLSWEQKGTTMIVLGPVANLISTNYIDIVAFYRINVSSGENDDGLGKRILDARSRILRVGKENTGH